MKKIIAGLTAIFFLYGLHAQDYLPKFNTKGISLGTNKLPATNVLLLLGDSSDKRAIILPRVIHHDSIANPQYGMFVMDRADSSLWIRLKSSWVKVAGGAGGAELDPQFDAKFSGKNTSSLPEGTNQYFTQSRARLSVSSNAFTGLSYDPLTGIFKIDSNRYSSAKALRDSIIILKGLIEAGGGAGTDTTKVPKTRTVTINGITKALDADVDFTVSASSVDLDASRTVNSVTVFPVAGTSATIQKADSFHAGVMDTGMVRKLMRTETVANEAELRTMGVDRIKSDIVYKFVKNKVIGEFYWDATSTATDDSVMVIKAGVYATGRFLRYYENYILANWWPLHPDGSADDSYNMQRAITFAIASPKTSLLKVLGGTYLISNAVIYHKTASEYDFVSMSIEGATPTHSTNGNVTIFKTYDTAVSILHIMSGRNIAVKNIAFVGPAVYPYGIKEIVEWTKAQWLTGNLRNNKYSPLSGVNIDPFFYAVSAPNRYPGMSSFYSNTLARATSQVTFTNCSWAGFPAAIAIGVNGYTQNCDNIRIEGGTQVGNMNFWVSGQNQSRDNVIQNLYSLGQTQTFINCTDYGSNQGTPPTLYDVSIAGGHKYLYQFNGPFAGFSMHGGHIESLYALGVSGTLPVNFFGTEIKLEVPIGTPNRTIFTSPTVAEGGPINFNGGSLEWFDEYNSQGWVFNNSSVNFNGTAVTGGTILNKVYRNGWTSFNGVAYKNIYGQNTLWQSKDIFGTDQSIYSGFYVIPGMKIKNTNFIDDGTSWTSESIDNQVENQLIESSTIKVDSVNHTAYFIAAAPKKYQLYEDIATLTAVDDPTDIFTANGYSHLGFIYAISSDTIKLAYIPAGVTNNALHAIYISRIPKYIGRSFGDVVSGSKNILHVQGNFWHATNRIKGPGIPIGAYVEAVSGDTVKISVAATSTVNNAELRDAKIALSTNAKYAGVYHKGDIVYSQLSGVAQDTVWAEVCTQAGYFTGSPAPVFKEIKFGGSSGGGGITYTIGAIDSLTKSSNGVVIGGNKLVFQTADATYPGLMSTGTQTIAGSKLFTSNFSMPSFTMSTINFTSPSGGAFKIAGTLGSSATFGATFAGAATVIDNDADGPVIFRSAGTAYYNLSIDHSTGVQALSPLIASSTLLVIDSARFGMVRIKAPNDSLAFLHNGVLRKGLPIEEYLASVSSGITLAQADSIAKRRVRDTISVLGLHQKDFTTTNATTQNVDTIFTTSGAYQTITIDVTCNAKYAAGAGAYAARKTNDYELHAGTLYSFGSPIDIIADRRTTGLTTANFTIITSGTFIIIQFTGETSKTINGRFDVHVTSTTYLP